MSFQARGRRPFPSICPLDPSCPGRGTGLARLRLEQQRQLGGDACSNPALPGSAACLSLAGTPTLKGSTAEHTAERLAPGRLHHRKLSSLLLFSSGSGLSVAGSPTLKAFCLVPFPSQTAPFFSPFPRPLSGHSAYYTNPNASLKLAANYVREVIDLEFPGCQRQRPALSLISFHGLIEAIIGRPLPPSLGGPCRASSLDLGEPGWPSPAQPPASKVPAALQPMAGCGWGCNGLFWAQRCGGAGKVPTSQCQGAPVGSAPLPGQDLVGPSLGRAVVFDDE